MELLSFFFYIVLVFLGLISLLKINGASQKLPPGPRPLPIIGNLLELGDSPHKSLANLAKTHGPIISLKLGQKKAYVISSPALAKEAFQKHDLDLSTRPFPKALNCHDILNYSIVWMPASAQRWRNLRKILNTLFLQNHKLNVSQNLRQERVNELIAYTKKCCDEGVSVDIGRAAFTTSLNMLSNTLFSKNLADFSEDSSNEFRDVISKIMRYSGYPNLADFFPALENLDPHGLRRQMTDCFGKIFKIVHKLIDERIESRRLEMKNDEQDMLDTLLNMGTDITRTRIEHLLTDLFIAGTDTTSTTVEWVMAEVLSNPEVLKKAKIELEEKIGKGKLIEESDIAYLPYLRAIMKETLRKHPPVPLKSNISETFIKIYEYTIPKGAEVTINIWAMGRDPDLFDNPTLFEPERFFGSDIDARAHNVGSLSFGLGRRSCPGIHLASRTVPVMAGSLLNSFDWKFEEGIVPEELDMDDKFGLTLQKAKPLCVIPISLVNMH